MNRYGSIRLISLQLIEGGGNTLGIVSPGSNLLGPWCISMGKKVEGRGLLMSTWRLEPATGRSSSPSPFLSSGEDLRSASLHTRKWVSQLFMTTKTKRTHEPRKTINASETSGRKRMTLSQHFCINVHNSSVRSGCVGRCGRLPRIIATIVATGSSSLNGTAPVNTCVKV